MLSDPATWVFFSFIIFIALSAKRLYALFIKVTDDYINNIRTQSEKLNSESCAAELALNAAKKRSLETDDQINAEIKESAERAKQIRQRYKESTAQLSEKIEAQFDSDIAIEVKFEKKQIVKRLCAAIREELLATFRKQQFDNNLINLDKLDLKKLFNQK